MHTKDDIDKLSVLHRNYRTEAKRISQQANIL